MATALYANNTPVVHDDHTKTCIWVEILKEASTASHGQKNATIICLGRKGAGKRSLMQAMKHVPSLKSEPFDEIEDGASVAVMDYEYMHVVNMEERDAEDVSIANVWMLDDPQHKELLIKRLKAEDLERSIVMIVLDLQQPWTIMEDFRTWIELVQEMIVPLLSSLPLDMQDKLRASVADYILAYREWSQRTKEEIEAEGGLFKVASARRFPSDTDDEKPDPSEALTVNLGVPIVVILNKCDLPAHQANSQQDLDLIQAHIRSACLPYGSALIYTSISNLKAPKNLNLLYKYVMHRLYHFDFKESPNGEQAIFVPTGHDSQEAITSLAQQIIPEGLQRPFESVIPKPLTKAKGGTQEPVIEPESMTDFLAKAMHLSKSTGSAAANRSVHNSSNTPLKNFFDNLLQKGVPASGPAVTKENSAAAIPTINTLPPTTANAVAPTTSGSSVGGGIASVPRVPHPQSSSPMQATKATRVPSQKKIP
eukprot:GHVL01008327.1.p1 GENE.GHVL01008327.1~~GHVL01008327.1.p1  ORF type:complete len:481 (-),score=73.43 GHVL01008327.1:64-1506(-)